MLPLLSRSLRPGLSLGLCAVLVALAGCGFNGATRRIADAVTPYKVEVVQGNFISSEQVAQLRPGLTRQQVRELLGTPLVTSVFHADRWDYVFTLKRQGVEPQARRLTVFFQGEALVRHEGDAMPSESEFVAAINKRRAGQVPPLQATEEQLRRNASKPSATPAPAAAPAPATAAYPPLEPAAR